MSILSSTEVVEPSLIVRGIKKRCRKTNNHIFYFKKRPHKYVDIEKLKSACEKAIKTKMRTVVSAHLSLQPMTVENT